MVMLLFKSDRAATDDANMVRKWYFICRFLNIIPAIDMRVCRCSDTNSRLS